MDSPDHLRPKLVKQTVPGLLPWGYIDNVVYDANDVPIGEMETIKMAKFLCECVNYIWETDEGQAS